MGSMSGLSAFQKLTGMKSLRQNDASIGNQTFHTGLTIPEFAKDMVPRLQYSLRGPIHVIF
jgi:hypothetical protein